MSAIRIWSHKIACINCRLYFITGEAGLARVRQARRNHVADDDDSGAQQARAGRRQADRAGAGEVHCGARSDASADGAMAGQYGLAFLALQQGDLAGAQAWLDKARATMRPREGVLSVARVGGDGAGGQDVGSAALSIFAIAWALSGKRSKLKSAYGTTTYSAWPPIQPPMSA